MRVLMLGWEFPPDIVGGLGTACYGLSRALAAEGAQVTFVLPGVRQPTQVGGVRLTAADQASPARRDRVGVAEAPAGQQDTVTKRAVRSRVYEPAVTVTADAAAVAAVAAVADGTPRDVILDEVERYAAGVERLARSEPFDLIHAHDWMTYPAGLRARSATGRPLVCHVHSTEFDRSGPHGDGAIVEIERQAFQTADRLITVSAHTKGVVVYRYGANPERVVVVHNAIDGESVPPAPETAAKPWERVVVFLGRLAFQKGPDYFVEAAARVLERTAGVKFVLAGRGPMLPQLVQRVAALRRGKDILFAGFLDRTAVGRILRMADLYVMTSVSEPFGIAALEAMAHGVPTIIPREAGVGEVVGNVLRVDFWDVGRLADRILAVLARAPLRHALGELGRREVGRLSWRDSARECLDVYRRTLGREALS